MSNTQEYACPCCGWRGARFGAFKGREHRSQCPDCKSLERHRLACMYLQRETDLFSGVLRDVLHISPELAIKRVLSAPYLRYQSCDIVPGRALQVMDLTDLDMPDSSYDFIFCSHVLEHIVDDLAAMREMCRVLRPGGWALIMVPVTSDLTYEDADAVTDAAREALFGQADHVRRYGHDVAGRLTWSGFDVTPVRYHAMLPAAQRQCLRLSDETLFVCRKEAKGCPTGKD